MKIPWEDLENPSDTREASYVYSVASTAISILQKKNLKDKDTYIPSPKEVEEKMVVIDNIFRRAFLAFVSEVFLKPGTPGSSVRKIEYPSKKPSWKDTMMIFDRLRIRLLWPFLEQPQQVSNMESYLIHIWSEDQPETKDQHAKKGLSREQVAWICSRSKATIQKHASEECFDASKLPFLEKSE